MKAKGMARLDQAAIKRLEERLRLGDQASVSAFLRQISRSDVPDSLKLSLSQIARRVGLARKGLLLLHSRVVSPPPGFSPLPGEQAEYAACLLKLGGISEARALLRQATHDRIGEAVKYLAFCYIHQWDFAQAVPLLREYIVRSDTGEYDKRVGSINLSAALIGLTQYKEAEGILASLIEPLNKASNRLLLGNVYELRAQIQIQTRQFSKAEAYLDESWKILKQAQPRYLLYLEKWRAVAALMRSPETDASLKTLLATRQRAAMATEWEVVRECDFYRSIIRQEEDLFRYLYVGTPHRGYRDLMLKKNGFTFSIPESYTWRSDARSLGVVDVELGRWSDAQLVTKNQGRHRLLKALTMDFYAPAPITELFHQIFDGEHFNPETSPARIHELVRRFKRDLQNSGLRLPILSLKGAYRLDCARGNCDLYVRRDRAVRISLLTEIEARYGEAGFRLRQLSDDLGLPHTTVYRQLKNLISDGRIEVIGEGRKSLYRIRRPISRSA